MRRDYVSEEGRRRVKKRNSGERSTPIAGVVSLFGVFYMSGV